jgi:hypothetical protein
MLKKFCSYVVTNFGFDDNNDFVGSIIHTNIMNITLPIAALSSLFENIFGLRYFTIVAFIILVTTELITGIIASRMRGETIESGKFSRFGLKITVWLILLYVTNTIKLEYNDYGNALGDLARALFVWLHGTLFIYITMEYFISVLENIGSISGKEKKSLIDSIINKLTNFMKK